MTLEERIASWELKENDEELNLSGLYLYSLPDIPVNATNVNLSNNYLTDIDIPLTIKTINLSCNRLSKVKLHSNLISVNLSYNEIIEFDELPDSLVTFICNNNQVNKLPELPIKLKYLSCNFNKLTDLPKLPLKLNSLYVNNNYLTHIDLLDLNDLNCLYCSNNKIQDINHIPISVNILVCNNNLLTDIPVLSKNIKTLDCSYNEITSLNKHNLTFMIGLKYCKFNNNPLIKEPVLNSRFGTYKLLPDILNKKDSRNEAYLNVLGQCYDLENNETHDISKVMLDANNILVKIYDEIYCISRQKILNSSNIRDNIYSYQNYDGKRFFGIKIPILGAIVNFDDFKKFKYLDYSIYNISRSNDLYVVENTVSEESYVKEFMYCNSYTIEKYTNEIL
jgi:Leucine-rich repeat (LRR) protein